jgi:hypothetical protein
MPPKDAPKELRDAWWTENGINGLVLLQDGKDLRLVGYSEIRTGDVFLQFHELRTKGRDRDWWARAKEDARVFADEGNTWGSWGVVADKIKGYPAGIQG